MAAILEISTAIGCPMTCSYCPQKMHVKNYRGGDRMMTLETFIKCVDKLPKQVDICFAGMVEPWVNDDASAMLLFAAIHNCTISVYTTCYRMTLEDVSKIRFIPFKHFTIHLPDAEGIMNLKVTPEYLEVLAEAIKIPNRNYTVIGKLHPDVEKITGPVHDGAKTLISRAGNLKDFFVQKLTGKLHCSMTPGTRINHNVLLPNGDVLLCCMDYGHKHVIGNLLENTYDELFESDKYKEVIAGMSDDNSDILCRTCEIATKV